MDRQETIDRLESLRDVIRADLRDESADRQVSLENTVAALTMLIGDLVSISSDAKVQAATAAIEMLLELVLPVPGDVAASKCDTCGNCTYAGCIVARLDPAHACSCKSDAANLN